jgi:hypothetical protein
MHNNIDITESATMPQPEQRRKRRVLAEYRFIKMQDNVADDSWIKRPLFG